MESVWHCEVKMIQGWHNNDYLILFGEQNAAITMTERYAVASSLPGFIVVGLKSWDDFILHDAKNRFFTVPTVPLDSQHLQPFVFNLDPSTLRADQRFIGKIRWFIKPLVFGGDPSVETNTAWLTVDEHVEAVKWWNQFYRDVKRNNPVA